MQLSPPGGCLIPAVPGGRGRKARWSLCQCLWELSHLGAGGWLAFSPASTCSRGSAWLPRVHPPRDARANLTLPLNWVKGGKGPQSPERISLLKHLEGNEQVPPGPLGVEQGARRSRPQPLCSGHLLRAESPQDSESPTRSPWLKS